jgi:hypothetical protein
VRCPSRCGPRIPALDSPPARRSTPVIDRCFEGWDGVCLIEQPDTASLRLTADAAFGKQIYSPWAIPMSASSPSPTPMTASTAVIGVAGHGVVALELRRRPPARASSSPDRTAFRPPQGAGNRYCRPARHREHLMAAAKNVLGEDLAERCTADDRLLSQRQLRHRAGGSGCMSSASVTTDFLLSKEAGNDPARPAGIGFSGLKQRLLRPARRAGRR